MWEYYRMYVERSGVYAGTMGIIDILKFQ